MSHAEQPVRPHRAPPRRGRAVLLAAIGTTVLLLSIIGITAVLRAGSDRAVPMSTTATGEPSASAAATMTTGTATTGSPSPSSPSTSIAPLAGMTIVIDPGHNGQNYAHPEIVNRQVDVLTKTKACDTTGTETNAGYAEHAFNWDLASRLATTLRKQGSTVVLTRDSDDGVGPCITERAAIGNREQADAAISLHADGAASSGRGFHVIMPGPVGPNDAIVEPSARLGRAIRDTFAEDTGQPYANYIAENGLDTRTDLGGLNLSTVPKVFLECGNMRNATDARKFTDPQWRQQAAEAIAAGMVDYLSAG